MNKDTKNIVFFDYLYTVLLLIDFIMTEHINFMRRAIELSIENIKNGGGPFGAVIVKDNEIISEGTNRVTANHDPTAHAEINAIRKAANILQTFDLSGCVIYTSCEPCPMCLGAIYWAHLDKIYYANTKSDAKEIGFDDSFIYDEIELKPGKRKLKSEQLLHDEAMIAFEKWIKQEGKINY
jgi:tRNA(Arg) A34 adenosine deaminase TadA